MQDRELEQLGVIASVAALNDDLQSWVSEHGAEVPADLLRRLSDLDWVVRNGYEHTRRRAVRALRRRGGAGSYRNPGIPLLEQARQRVERILAWGPWNPDPEPEPDSDPRRQEREEVDRTDYSRLDLTPDRTRFEIADGWVWCEDHGAVHEDTTTPYEDGEACSDTSHRDVLRDTRDPYGG